VSFLYGTYLVFVNAHTIRDDYFFYASTIRALSTRLLPV